jgi:hypothetical protein
MSGSGAHTKNLRSREPLDPCLGESPFCRHA